MKLEAKSQVEYYNLISELTPMLNSNPNVYAKHTGVVPSSTYFILEASKLYNSNPIFCHYVSVD